MKAVVLYESLYGNTAAAVARAVADRLGPIAEVTLAQFGEAPEGVAEEADLLVVGGPTHGWGMTRPASRKTPRSRAMPWGLANGCRGFGRCRERKPRPSIPDSTSHDG